MIVISYAEYDEAELDAHQPIVVHVDASNKPIAPAAAGR